MDMRLEIIAVGSEVLWGEVQGDNARVLSRVCTSIGVEPDRVTVLPDDIDVLADEFRSAAERGGTVIVTGGLGPTADDVTKEAAIRALGLATRERPEIVIRIEERFREFGRRMPASYRDQAVIPDGAEILPNTVGLAVGLRIDRAGFRFYLLPGVPTEMREMFERNVLPELGADGRNARERLRTFGLSETEVEERLARVPEMPADRLSIISSPSGVDVYLPAAVVTGERSGQIKTVLGSYLYGTGDRRMPEIVLDVLRDRERTLAVAESVTGGLLASTLVAVPGASDVFVEGYITYSNEAKVGRLGVDRSAIDRSGAVSSGVCAAMAAGARAASSADFALSTTGIAGPGGGTKAKPVGLCFVGLAAPDGLFVREFTLPGDRETVRLRAVFHALDLLRLHLAGESGRIERFEATDEA